MRPTTWSHPITVSGDNQNSKPSENRRNQLELRLLDHDFGDRLALHHRGAILIDPNHDLALETVTLHLLGHENIHAHLFSRVMVVRAAATMCSTFGKQNSSIGGENGTGTSG